MAKTVDVVISQNPFNAVSLLDGAAKFGRTKGNFRLAAVFPDHPAVMVEKLRQSPAVGAIVNLMGLNEYPALAAMGKPVVNMISSATQFGLPSVVPDDLEVGRMAGEHLLQQGYTRLAYLGSAGQASQKRHAGVISASTQSPEKLVCHSMKSAAQPDQQPEWAEATDPERIRDWIRSLLPGPIGVVCFNDQVATALVDACELAQLRVPDEVGIIGVDNTNLRCEYAQIRLSSVDIGFDRIGYAAAELLYDVMIEKRSAGIQLLIVPPIGVVARQSTDALIFTDPDVRAAVAYIRENFGSGIRVPDVLRHVNVSRSSLEKRFRKKLGRLPAEEIRRVRIAHARRLLATTTLPVIDVAIECGFEHLSNFSTAFKASTGIGPSAYRATLTSR